MLLNEIDNLMLDDGETSCKLLSLLLPGYFIKRQNAVDPLNFTLRTCYFAKKDSSLYKPILINYKKEEI